jgi:hypothetical protein
MKLRSLQIIALGTGAAALAISALAAFVMLGAPLDLASRTAVTWVPPPDQSAPQAPVSTAQDVLADVLARPVFLPGRKPFQPPPPPAPAPQAEVPPPVVMEPAAPPPAPAPVAPAPPPPLNATLKGVLLTDALDKAYLVYPQSPDGAWVTVGMEIDGWKLTRIAKDQVTLVLGGQKLVLQLYVDNPAMPVGNAATAN